MRHSICSAQEPCLLGAIGSWVSQLRWISGPIPLIGLGARERGGQGRDESSAGDGDPI